MSYNERLGAFDDAAPAAFANQNNYDVEMHKKGRAGLGSVSQGSGAQHPVYLGDAASVPAANNEFNFDKQLPDMVGGGPGNHQYYRSQSIRDIDSPREEWAANPNAPDPTKGVCGLYIISAVCIVSCMAAASAFEKYILMIFMDMGADGTYSWNLGWNGRGEFSYLDNASNDAREYIDYSDSEVSDLFPLPNTFIYLSNAGYMLLFMIIVSIFCVIFILIIVCSRANSHILLYISCCCCKIPQRAAVYFLFDILKTFSWITTIYFIFVMIYGLLETNYFLAIGGCASGAECWSYVIPHYGFFSLLFIVFSISCCAFSKVQALDIKFSTKSMGLYYPLNVYKAEEHDDTLKLEYLFAVVNSLKYIIILLFVILIGFREVGLIGIYFSNDTLSELPTNEAVVFFQFQGLINSNGIGDLIIEADILNENWINNSTSITSIPHNSNSSAVESFKSTSSVFNYFIYLILIINLFIFLPYIWSVIHKYKSYGICKFSIVLFSFIQILIFTILLIVYYYEYYVFFHNEGGPNLTYELELITGHQYTAHFYPDWGLIICCILWFYMIRLIYTAFKAM